MVLLSQVWWNDPGVLIGLVVGLFGIVIGATISIAIYFKQRARKQITYQVLSDAPIVNIDKRVEDKVKIIDKDSNNELNDANLVSLKVWNAGDTDVKVWNAGDEDVEDLEEPIIFKFEGRAVVSLTELETDPPEKVIDSKNLEKYLRKPSLTPDSIGLPRCLLKPRQSISLSVLVNGSKGEIHAEGKLYQGKITKFKLEGQPTTVRAFPGLLWPLGVAMYGGLIWLFYNVTEPFKTIIAWIIVVPFLLIILFPLWLIIIFISFIRDVIRGKKKIKLW